MEKSKSTKSNKKSKKRWGLEADSIFLDMWEAKSEKLNEAKKKFDVFREISADFKVKGLEFSPSDIKYKIYNWTNKYYKIKQSIQRGDTILTLWPFYERVEALVKGVPMKNTELDTCAVLRPPSDPLGSLQTRSRVPSAEMSTSSLASMFSFSSFGAKLKNNHNSLETLDDGFKESMKPTNNQSDESFQGSIRKKKAHLSLEAEVLLLELWEEKSLKLNSTLDKTRLYREIAVALKMKSYFLSPGEIKSKIYCWTNKYKELKASIDRGEPFVPWSLYDRIKTIVEYSEMLSKNLTIIDPQTSRPAECSLQSHALDPLASRQSKSPSKLFSRKARSPYSERSSSSTTPSLRFSPSLKRVSSSKNNSDQILERIAEKIEKSIEQSKNFAEGLLEVEKARLEEMRISNQLQAAFQNTMLDLFRSIQANK